MKTINANSMVEQYEAQGYLLVSNLFSVAECQALKEAGVRVMQEKAKPNQSVFGGAAVASPVFYNFASDARMVEILSPIMPDGVMFMSDKFVFKSKAMTFATHGIRTLPIGLTPVPSFRRGWHSMTCGLKTAR